MGDGKIRRIAVIINGDTEPRHLKNVERAAKLFGDKGYNLYIASPNKTKQATLHVEPTSIGLTRIFQDISKIIDNDDELVVYKTGHGDKEGGGCIVLQDKCVPKNDPIFKKLYSLPFGKRTVIMSQCLSGNWCSMLVNGSKTLFASAGSEDEKVCCNHFDPKFFAPDEEIEDKNKDGTISWRERYAATVSRATFSRSLLFEGSDYIDTGVAGSTKEPSRFKAAPYKVSNRNEYNEYIKKLQPGEIAVAMFSMPNCKPCEKYQPKFEKLAKSEKGKTLFIYVPDATGSEWDDLKIKGYPQVYLVDHRGQHAQVLNIDNPMAARCSLGQGNKASFLLSALKKDDIQTAWGATQSLIEMKAEAKTILPELKEMLNDKSPLVRICAAYVMANLDFNLSKKAISVLIDELQLNNEGLGELAAIALGELGPQAKIAVHALIGVLLNSYEALREQSANALMKIGPWAESAVPTLLMLLSDGNNNIRTVAMGALLMIGPKFKDSVSVLENSLKDSDEHVSGSAAYLLASFGPRAKKTVPALMGALQAGRKDLCVAAAHALAKIDKQSTIKAVRYLTNVLRGNKTQKEKEAAAVALGSIGSAAKKAVPALIDALRSRDKKICLAAIEGLQGIGPLAKSAVPILINLSKNPDEEISVTAILALGKISHATRRVVSTLIDLSKHSDEYIHAAAIVSLGKMGAKNAKSALKAALKDRDPLIRKSALEGLIRICTEKDMASLLVNVLRDDDEVVRLTAVSLLWERESQAKKVTPSLIKALKDSSDDVRMATAYLLIKLDCMVKESIGILLGKLHSTEPYARLSVMSILRKLGPKAKDAVPSLVRILSNKDDYLREIAVHTLRKIGPKARSAVPALNNALNSDDKKLRMAAALALAKIDEKATNSIPALMWAMVEGTEETCLEAALALGKLMLRKIDTEACPPLKKE